MPINENTSKTSIEFTYENMEKSVFQNIRYSYTEHHGPTITLLSEDGSDLYSAPAEMFIDVVRFLSSKNVIKMKDEVLSNNNESSFKDNLPMNNIDPISSFSNSVPSSDFSLETNENDLGSISMPSFEEDKNEYNSISVHSNNKENTEDAAKYNQERMEAIKRAKASGKRIVRKE